MSFACSCFNCEEMSPEGSGYDDCNRVAGEAGWVIGLERSGQAHYACPHCAHMLFNAIPLNTGLAARSADKVEEK